MLVKLLDRLKYNVLWSDPNSSGVGYAVQTVRFPVHARACAIVKVNINNTFMMCVCIYNKAIFINRSIMTFPYQRKEDFIHRESEQRTGRDEGRACCRWGTKWPCDWLFDWLIGVREVSCFLSSQRGFCCCVIRWKLYCKTFCQYRYTGLPIHLEGKT